MTVTFKIGETDVTPEYSTFNPISVSDSSNNEGSWCYYVYYPLCLNTTNLSISYSGLPSGDAYMCFQASGGSFGTVTIELLNSYTNISYTLEQKYLDNLQTFLTINDDLLSAEQKATIKTIIETLKPLEFKEQINTILSNIPQDILESLSSVSSQEKLQLLIYELTLKTITTMKDDLVYIEELLEPLTTDMTSPIYDSITWDINGLQKVIDVLLDIAKEYTAGGLTKDKVENLINKYITNITEVYPTIDNPAFILLLQIADLKRIISAGGGGGGGQVYSVPLADTGSLSVTIYAIGSEIDSIVMDASGNTSVGVGKNGSNAIIKPKSDDVVITSVEFIGGNGGNGGNASSNCKGGGGGNGGSYSITNNDLKNINEGKITITNTTGTPGVGYNSGSSGGTGDNNSGYVLVDFEDETTAKLGNGGQEKKSGNTPFVMVYYKV